MAENHQKTLIILKPDAVKRRLIGEIIRRFEIKGFSIAQMKLMTIPRQMAEIHYAEHKGKGFYEDLVGFITGGPVVVIALQGPEAISVARRLMGKTKFTEADPGTIRGDFAHDLTANLIHGSDSPESAQRELKLFFGE
jgi:nucleoside-diphosphate kinase